MSSTPLFSPSLPSQHNPIDPATSLWLELATWPVDQIDDAVLRLLDEILTATDAVTASATIIWSDRPESWRFGASLQLNAAGQVTHTKKSRRRGLDRGPWAPACLAHLHLEASWRAWPGMACVALHLGPRVAVWLRLDGITYAPLAWLDHLTRGLARPLRLWCRSHGLVGAQTHLAPRSRETMLHLLTGASEKEIAWEMGLSPASVHQTVVALYRHFGVQSRAEFMASWWQMR